MFSAVLGSVLVVFSSGLTGLYGSLVSATIVAKDIKLPLPLKTTDKQQRR